MGTFGVAMFDVSDDKSRDKIWRDLGTRVLRTTKSCCQFDMKDADFVNSTVRKHIAASDNFFEASAMADDAHAKSWARKAMIEFVAEVMDKMKARVALLQKELEDGKKGIGDVSVAIGDKAREIEKKVEDQMVRLAIFRLGEEFAVQRDAILADLEVQHDLAMVMLCNAAQKVEAAKTAPAPAPVEPAAEPAAEPAPVAV